MGFDRGCYWQNNNMGILWELEIDISFKCIEITYTFQLLYLKHGVAILKNIIQRSRFKHLIININYEMHL